MPNELASSIEQLAAKKTEFERQEQLMFDQWQDLRGKIDSILLSNNVLKSDEARKLCQEIDVMGPEERKEHITVHWGLMYCERVEPLLHQVEVLESNILKYQNENQSQNS